MGISGMVHRTGAAHLHHILIPLIAEVGIRHRTADIAPRLQKSKTVPCRLLALLQRHMLPHMLRQKRIETFFPAA
ncbi:hypothetical protein D3C81_2123470 [compost metagenome]